MKNLISIEEGWHLDIYGDTLKDYISLTKDSTTVYIVTPVGSEKYKVEARTKLSNGISLQVASAYVDTTAEALSTIPNVLHQLREKVCAIQLDVEKVLEDIS